MADNTVLNAGSGGDTFAADDIGGVKYPRSKITIGDDGTNDGDVSAANPLPVAGEVTVSGSVAVTGTFYQATQPVSGTFWQATQPVSAASLPLPSGAATEASLAAAAASLAVLDDWDESDRAKVNPIAGQAGVQGGSGTVSALTQRVVLATDVALPAGDAAIGRVKLTDGTDVLDILDLTNSNPAAVAIVDGSGTQITSFGGGTQYTEGDTDASITGTAMLWEDAGNTLRPVAAGTPLPVAIISGAGSGGTAAADDADFTAGTTSGTPIMGVADGAANVTSGDLGVVGMTLDRKLWTYDAAAETAINSLWTLIDGISSSGSAIALESTQVAIHDFIEAIDDSTVTIAGNTGSSSTVLGATSDAATSGAGTINAHLRFIAATGIPITGTVTVGAHDLSGSALTALQLIDDAVATAGSAITAKGMAAVGTDGTNARVLKTDSSGELQVDVLTMPAVAGAAAEDAAASGNPVPVGLVARRARITAMSADGDVVRATADRYGRQQVVGADLSAVAVQATASGDTALVAAPGAGNRLKIVRVKLCNSHASTALTVGVKTAAHNSGSVFEKNYLPAAGGQAVINFPLGHLICGDNEAFNVNLSATGQIECTVYYEVIAN